MPCNCFKKDKSEESKYSAQTTNKEEDPVAADSENPVTAHSEDPVTADSGNPVKVTADLTMRFTSTPNQTPAEDTKLFEWLNKEEKEDILLPDIEIVDPHHHLWQGIPMGQRYYLQDQLLEDLRDGHNVLKTIYVQCGSFYDKSLPKKHLMSTGEVQKVQEIADQNLNETKTQICAAIVGTCDLTLSTAELQEAIDTMKKCPNFRGIRATAPYNQDPEIKSVTDSALKLLVKNNLSLDIWHWPKPTYEIGPLQQFKQMALENPDLTLILNHLGGAVGPSMDQNSDDTTHFESWKSDILDLAQTNSNCSNVYVKLGGMCMAVNGFKLDQENRTTPVGSEELSELLLPYMSHVIDCFGAKRCMFESNFPVDKLSVSYRVLWNAYKRIAIKKKLNEEEMKMIFGETAKKVYRI